MSGELLAVSGEWEISAHGSRISGNFGEYIKDSMDDKR